jgi:competence protein ComEC
VADRFRPLPLGVWWLTALGAWCGWWIFWRRGRLVAAMATILLAAAATAASWHHGCWFLFPADDLGQFAREDTQPACVEVRALQMPRAVPRADAGPMSFVRAGDVVRMDVEVLAVRDGARWRPADGRCRLSVDGLLPGIEAGDRLRVFGHLTVPPPAQNPGGYDMAEYVRGERVRSYLQAKFSESVTLLAPGSPWNPWRWLDKLRSGGRRILANYLDHKRATMAAAVLLGAREQLEPDRIEPYVETGTIHLLVIAGLHLGILAGAVLLLAGRLPIPWRWTLLGVAGFAVLYMLLVDAQPPVVRATVMVVAICGAALTGRRHSPFNTLAAAALLVLAVNPVNLFRTGAQLSFLCVVGLMWFMPLSMRKGPFAGQDPVARLLRAGLGPVPRTARQIGRWLWVLLSISLTIWLMTMPLVMARFHILAPVSAVVNPLVWAPMALALVSGLVTLLLGGWIPPLAHVSGGLCNGCLGLVEGLVGLAQRVPGGHFWVPGPADWWLAGFYGGLGLLAAFPRLRPPRRWCLALLAAWTTIGFAAAGPHSAPDRLRCTFLSVGHGGAEVLEFPSGKTMLYDAGEMGSPASATRTIAGFLWSRGITRLDAVVLSHADVDHYNGLPGVLERFSVGAVYVTRQMFEKSNPAIRALHDLIIRSRVPLREVWSGNRLLVGDGCSAEVLHPPWQGVVGSDNANSLTLLVTCRQDRVLYRILLTGDLAPPGLDDVMAEQPLHCDVLLVPHHGSRTSEPAELAAWSTPRWAVISNGRELYLRPVRAIYEAAGSRTLLTAETGAVSVTIDPSGIRAEGFRGHKNF